MKILPAAAICVATFTAGTQAFFISGISPSAWDADSAIMNANLGIDETFIIEDFEDLTFVPGLTWSKVNSTTPESGPQLDNAPGNPGNWDGELSLRAEHDFNDGDAIFTFSDPLSMFGIGIADLNPANIITVSVDGNEIGATDTLGAFARELTSHNTNGYLWITAEEGESFHEITLICNNTDRFYYDHCALKVDASTVPEPGILWFFGIGITVIFLATCRNAVRMKLRRTR